MKSLLNFIIAMDIIVTMGDAFCMSKLQSPGKVYRGCMLNGKLYPLGHIERTEDCYQCTCSRTEMSCCSLYFTPIAYDKENCKITLNKKRCEYDVVQRSDPSKECSSFVIATG